MASAILGDWTHRRGDRGGARAVAAEIDRPSPVLAWSWRPEHRGRVDQVRVAGQNVYVATMMPQEPDAPGWEHAVVYALDARTGAVAARRVLPDPVPVAAMAFEAGKLHVVGTRKGEPIFSYALAPSDLFPLHRRVVALAPGVRHDDVLDAWAVPDGGLWLELDAALGEGGRHTLAYAFADADGVTPAACSQGEDVTGDGTAAARDACAGEDELFTPVAGQWAGEGGAVPPSLCRLTPRDGSGRADAAWMHANVVGPQARIHAVAGGGRISGVAIAQEPARQDRARIEAFAIDRESSVVQWRAYADRIGLRPPLGEAARLVHRPDGELLFQSLGADRAPCTPLLCARPDGRLDSILLGARGRWVLDAALGELVLAHREDDDGRVEVGGFAIDQEGRLLGRRAVPVWSFDPGDLGGGTTVYAGAGAVVVRGARAVCAITL
ncbi:MAG: hypothetical protein M3O36_16975 [Myxococcota bacterium]|nr:hypothetical protein [Myxococcota bacterium]